MVLPTKNVHITEYTKNVNRMILRMRRIEWCRYEKSSYITVTAFGGGSRGSRTPDPLLVRQTL